MATFIKAGFWQKLCDPCEGYKNWLNLDKFVSNIVNTILRSTPNGLYSQTADGTEIVNTDVESDLVGPGVGSLSVPANGFKVGDSFVARMGGIISTSGGSDFITIRIESLNGVTVELANSGSQSLPGLSDESFTLELNFTIRSIGEAGTAEILTVGIMAFQKSSSGSMEGFEFRSLNNTTFDTTKSATLDITAQWASADPGSSIKSQYFTLHKLY